MGRQLILCCSKSLTIILLFTSILWAGEHQRREKVYDKNWNLQYRIEGDKVYDKHYNLKYRIEGDRIYDKNWNKVGETEKRNNRK